MFEAQIQKGIEWLNQEEPGWLHNIDLQSLDMILPCNCILGQVYGHFYSIIGYLDKDKYSFEWANEHGFYIEYEGFLSEEEEDKLYNQLSFEWGQAINQLKCDQQTLKIS